MGKQHPILGSVTSFSIEILALLEFALFGHCYLIYVLLNAHMLRL